MKNSIFLIALFLFASLLTAQVQTIRGNIRDKESHANIAKASIKIKWNVSDSAVTFSDDLGNFELNNIPIGRHDLLIIAKDYKMQLLNNIIVTSAKEVILQIDLEDDFVNMKTVSVRAVKQNKANNDNATVSARLFTPDETDRFAGSRGDPARMASNFAGVQGANDSRNDIVIRGNSPGGVLWRLEGIDIPNPNHFSIPGTTGGPVSIINNKILANSDFFTGAFPAEYGNSTAGVFDLRLRNGNNKKLEFSSQLGFLGWDVLAEGPFSKKSKNSFLFTYRYSTLALFSKLKIPIGTDAVPNYQDFSYKFNFILSKKTQLSFFGIGGTSNINILISNQKEAKQNLYGDNDRDQLFKSKMGVFGTSLTYNINAKSYLKSTIAFSHQQIDADHKLVFRTITGTKTVNGAILNIYRLDSLVPNLDYTFRTNSIGTNTYINKKINAAFSIRYGVQITNFMYYFQDSNRNFDFKDTAHFWKWSTRWNADGNGLLLQPYALGKYKFNSKFSIVAGINNQFFSIKDNNSKLSGNDMSIFEPRLGGTYLINKKQSLSFGLGAHSQIQAPYTYFYIKPGNTKPHNMGMGMSRSKHAVLAYDISLLKNKRIKIETYYQQLSKLPVEKKTSSFSLANSGSGFSRFFPDTLVNTGTGYNYGIEFTFEKFFSKGMYYLTTFSLFDAKYKGSDAVLRNSDFNTGYALNGLIAKEWVFNKRKSLNVGGKLTMAGARRYSPMDTLASRRQREYVEVDALKNTKKFGSNYLRLDVRIAYKINSKKLTHEFAFDLVNITNRKNILKYSYLNEAPYVKQEYQLGFLPLFYYKLDF